MVGELRYHIVWCTKYRRKLLVDKFEIELKRLIKEIALDNNWEIIEQEVMPDHVHLFVKAGSKDSVHRIISQFKGRTSFNLRKIFPELKSRMPCLWTRSYYADSIGNASSETIKKYILNQKKERRNSSES